MGLLQALGDVKPETETEIFAKYFEIEKKYESQDITIEVVNELTNAIIEIVRKHYPDQPDIIGTIETKIKLLRNVLGIKTELEVLPISSRWLFKDKLYTPGVFALHYTKDPQLRTAISFYNELFRTPSPSTTIPIANLSIETLLNKATSHLGTTVENLFTLTNEKGNTILHQELVVSPRYNLNPVIAKLFEHKELCKKIINLKNHEGETPLFFCATVQSDYNCENYNQAT